MDFNRLILLDVGKINLVILCPETIWGDCFWHKILIRTGQKGNRYRKLEPEYLTHVFGPNVE